MPNTKETKEPKEEITEEIAEAIKQDFLKLLISMQSNLPKDKQNDLNPLIEAVKSRKLPKEVRLHLSVVLGLIFAGAPHGMQDLMNDKNLKIVKAFEKKYIDESTSLKAALSNNTPQESKPGRPNRRKNS
jgi:hypothetical protein